MSRHFLQINRISQDKLFALIGLIAALPVIYFVTGSIMKYELGLLQSIQIHTFPPALLLGGGLLALVLNFYPLVRLSFLRSHNSFTLSVTLNFKPLNFMVFSAAGLIMLVLVGYVIAENLTPH